MDWSTGLSRPTWAVIMARTGLARRTVARWIRWLRTRHLLGLAVPGSTPRYRPGTAAGLIDDGLGNLAAEYVLAVPRDLEDENQSDENGSAAAVVELRSAVPGDRTGTPSRVLSHKSKNITDNFRNARAHTHTHKTNDTAITWPRTVTPRTKTDQLRACERLRLDDLTLRRLSARHLRSILRPLFLAGATPADVAYMINHAPDGTPWPYTGMPRFMPAWLRWRLHPWLEKIRIHGADVLPSRRAEAARAAAAAHTAQLAADYAEARARRAEATPYVQAARTALAAVSSRSAVAMRRRTTRHSDQLRHDPSRWDRIDQQAAAAVASVRATEPEDVFRRDVLDRHAIPSKRTYVTARFPLLGGPLVEPEEVFHAELAVRKCEK